MGNVFSICSCKRHRVGSIREITLLMIGLDNAGKTCTVKHLLGEPTADAVPTVGFSSISVKHGKFNVTIYDLGGGPKIRGIWKKYFALVHGLIFVVDASDYQRLEECKVEIKNVLKNEKIAGKPMLVLVNKQDINGALDETELVSRLDLEVLVNEQKCPTRVESSCALYDEKKLKDPGIQEGFNWLIGLISRDFDDLHQRVEQEVNEQKRFEEKEQAERIERVRKLREEREKMAENDPKLLNKKKDCDDDDDDDDVIIGNPFKSCNVIKAELEEKEQKKALVKQRVEQELSTPAVKVIHVSPTNSVEGSNREEIILLPQPLANPSLAVSHDKISYLNHYVPDSIVCNGNSVAPFCVEEDTKKKTKKNKKRFKNRVVPDFGDANGISLISKVHELPPLRPIADILPNGQPSVYVSPKRRTQQNGKINWALAEELEPCKEVPNVGSSKSGKRTEAWIETVH